MKNSLMFILLAIIAGCSARQRETFAHITQRRVDHSGKLMISYQFHAGEKLVYDSMEVQNRVVPHDSVKVVFAPDNPAESHLLLP